MDYFTIYDFVKAYHHFSDRAWDGEPLAPLTSSRVHAGSALGAFPRVSSRGLAEPQPPPGTQAAPRLKSAHSTNGNNKQYLDAESLRG
jgi:hypothetical protein